MLHKVVRYLNNPILERPADPVTAFDTPELQTLIDDMFETMYASHGIGLAGPQIEVGKRITVIDVAGADEEEGKAPEKIVLINPAVLAKEGKQTGEEGCLSIPGFREPVSRAKFVAVRAQDVRGAELGKQGWLGWSTWMGTKPRDTDADDFIFEPDIKLQDQAESPSSEDLSGSNLADLQPY